MTENGNDMVKTTAVETEESFTTRVLDTRHLPQRDAFATFHDLVSSAFLPWLPEYTPGDSFRSRIETIELDEAIIGRICGTPISSSRGAKEISRSQGEYFYASFILSGEMVVDQNGKCEIAGPGNLVMHDSCRSAVVCGDKNRTYTDAIALMIPKKHLSNMANADELFGNFLVPKERMIYPLFSTFEFIANNLVSGSQKELSALYTACISLLPLLEGRDRRIEQGFENAVTQDLLSYVNQNLSDPMLSARTAAVACGISERYVHKLFAARSVTFSAFVMGKRLDHVRAELSSHEPISATAYRWGFSDLSTFIRAFKKRFGSTPSRFRSRADKS